MTNTSLRRRLEELKRRRAVTCPECTGKLYIVMDSLPPKPGQAAPDRPPEFCPACGQKGDVIEIRMLGLPDKSRGHFR
jgi:rubrerythrin